MRIVKELAFITISALLIFGFFTICIANSPANNQELASERQ